MAVHVGLARMKEDSLTRCVEYSGPAVTVAAHVMALAPGGRVLVTQSAKTALKMHGDWQLICLGAIEDPELPPGTCALLSLVTRT